MLNEHFVPVAKQQIGRGWEAEKWPLNTRTLFCNYPPEGSLIRWWEHCYLIATQVFPHMLNQEWVVNCQEDKHKHTPTSFFFFGCLKWWTANILYFFKVSKTQHITRLFLFHNPKVQCSKASRGMSYLLDFSVCCSSKESHDDLQQFSNRTSQMKSTKLNHMNEKI